jgi:signal transduction histidine kinase
MTDYIGALKDEGIDPQSLLNNINSIFAGISLDGRVLFMNRQAEQIFSDSYLKAEDKHLGSFPGDFNWDAIREGIVRCAAEKRTIALSDISYEYFGRKGLLGLSIVPLSSRYGSTAGFLIYGADVTARRKLEHQIIQSSKMATIGEMATGIAHEMNQPLNIMKIAAQRLEDGIEEGYALKEFALERVGVIIEQINRLSGIINHFRVFGRTNEADIVPVDICLPVRNAFKLLGEQLKGHDILVNLDLPESLPKIAGSAPRLEQVFINLIVNSRDALSEQKTGTPKTITVKVSFDSAENLIVIEYNDSGPGINAEIVNRIFEPFFTTKVEGKGTGLGLSISAGIISEHGGSIMAEQSTTGARFVIFLPVLKEKGLNNE